MVRGLKLFGILAVSVLFITGCGNSEKTLTCTMSEEDDGLSMEQTVDLSFSDDKVTNVKMSIDTKITDSTYQENWDMFVSTMESQYEESSANGIKVTTENDSDNYTYTITVDANLEEASEDDLSNYGLDAFTEEGITYEETKQEAEDAGYTCK